MTHSHPEVARFARSPFSSDPPALTRRAVAALRQGELDRRLADGEEDDDGWLSVRAWQLTRPRERARVAGALEDLLHVAQRSDRGVDPVTAAVRDDVRESRAELLRAVSRLRDGRPVQPRGMASLRDLLSDGSGPLYWPNTRDELRERLQRAVDELG